MAQPIHRVAQICANGHVISPAIDNYPGLEQNFCSTCGSKTLTACSNCRKPIRGTDRYTMRDDYYTKPAYCADCGAAFPWTQSAINAAKELAVQVKMQEMDRTELPALIENLVRQTPSTPVAAIKLKAALEKVGPLAGEGFKQILIGVVTEGAKKLIWPAP